MITKGMFADCINALRNNFDFQNGIVNLARQYDPYSDLGTMNYPCCNDALLELLTEVMNDTETRWIEYYCYDIDFGRDWKPGTVTDETGDIPLSSTDDLWRLLTNEE